MRYVMDGMQTKYGGLLYHQMQMVGCPICAEKTGHSVVEDYADW